jgi:hypothetical protein
MVAASAEFTSTGPARAGSGHTSRQATNDSQLLILFMVRSSIDVDIHRAPVHGWLPYPRRGFECGG